MRGPRPRARQAEGDGRAQHPVQRLALGAERAAEIVDHFEFVVLAERPFRHELAARRRGGSEPRCTARRRRARAPRSTRAGSSRRPRQDLRRAVLEGPELRPEGDQTRDLGCDDPRRGVLDAADTDWRRCRISQAMRIEDEVSLLFGRSVVWSIRRHEDDRQVLLTSEFERSCRSVLGARRRRHMFKDSKAFSSFSTNDLGAAKKFCGDTLGLEVVETPEGLELRRRRHSGVRVSVRQLHRAKHTLLNFPVEDIDSAVEELARQGVSMEPACRDQDRREGNLPRQR